MIEIIYSSGQEIIDTVASDSCIDISDVTDGNRHTVSITARSDISLNRATVPLRETFGRNDLVMTNGYQSWTETKEFVPGEHLNDLTWLPKKVESIYHFRSYGSQAFMPMDRNELTGFDFSYVKGEDPLFIGSYNMKNAYLVIRFRLTTGMIILESDVSGKVLKAGETFTLFDYVLTDDPSGKEYFDSFYPASDRKIFGYTSWYNHYQNINEEKINDALDKSDPRFDLFQIDDGFETHVGDWLDIDQEKFPEGLKSVVDRIHEKGMMAGIWLAPLVCETVSKTAEEHPDWIARNDAGEPIYAGSNWSGFMPLDLNKFEVVEYVRSVLRKYVELEFDFFKLDFLYACNLKPLTGHTRAETSEFIYSLIRDELKGKLILGCGAILSNAAEKFDYCRIGPDVSLTFDDVIYMRMFHAERISTRVTIKNTIFRSMLNGHFFMNDPDVFLLRDNTKLTVHQRISLSKINALFGSLLMTSDDIASYNDKKVKVLTDVLDLFYNGKVISYKREKMNIIVEYELRGDKGMFVYNSVTGTIIRRKNENGE